MRDDPYTLLNKAAGLLKKKNFDVAALVYQELGDYFLKKGFYEKAVASYQKAVELAHDPRLYVLIADIYETLHRSFAALEALNRALEALKTKEAADPLTSVIQQKIKKLTTPLEPRDFPVGPQNEERWKNMIKDAKLLLEESLFGDAKKIYEKILLESPLHAEAKSALLDIQEKETAFFGKRTEVSVTDLIQSLEQDLGLMEEKVPEKLIQTQTPLQTIPAETLYDLAIGYTEMGLHAKAIEHLEQALDRAPEAIEQMKWTVLLASCYLKEKRHNDAILLLEKTLNEKRELLEKIPKEYRLTLRYVLSEAFEQKGDLNSALSNLRIIEKEDRKYRDTKERIRKIRSLIR